MAPALAPKALERGGVSPVCCTLMPSASPLAALPPVSTYCSPYTMACRCPVVQGSLSKTSLAVMGAGAARSTPVCLFPPMSSLNGAIWGTGQAAALHCPAQGGQQFSNLLTQSCGALPRVSDYSSPRLYLVPDLLILTFHLLGSNH